MVLEKLLLFLLILLLPAQLALHFWPSWSFVSGLPVDYLSPTLYLTDILILSLIALRPPKIRIPLFVIMFSVLNIAVSVSPPVTLLSWFRLLEYYAFFRYLVSTHPTISSTHLALSGSVVWSTFLAWAQFLSQGSLGGLLYWLGERPLSPVLPGVAKIIAPAIDWSTGRLAAGQLIMRPYSTFPHPNALAAFLLVSALILFIQAIKPGSKSRIVLWVGVIGAALTIPVTFSRAVLFMGFLLLVAFITAKISNIKLKVFFAVSLFLLLLHASTLLPGNPTSFAERLSLVDKSLSIIHHTPLTGIGLGSFPAHQHLQSSASTYLLHLQPVHNIYLLLASELGLPATLLISYWVFMSLGSNLLINHRKLALPVFVVLVTGLVDHYWLTSHQNQLLLVLLFAFLKIQSISHDQRT